MLLPAYDLGVMPQIFGGDCTRELICQHSHLDAAKFALR